MAVRLSVIMVHSTPPTATAQQLAQQVVGELIGLQGIDLTLVEPFSQLHESSTDRLTLGSLGGDVAVLDWQSPAEILTSLASIDFQGKRSPHQHDREIPSAPANSRRIYAYDLSKFSRADDVIAALSRLNADRQVRAFSLGPPPISLASSSDPVSGENTPIKDIPEAPLRNPRDSVETDPPPPVTSQSLLKSDKPPSQGRQRQPAEPKTTRLGRPSRPARPLGYLINPDKLPQASQCGELPSRGRGDNLSVTEIRSG